MSDQSGLDEPNDGNSQSSRRRHSLSVRPMRRRGAITQGDDKRVTWFEERVCASLALTSEDFKDMLLDKDCKAAISTFMDETNHSEIFFYLCNRQDRRYLQCSEIGPPSNSKSRKIICFLKEKRDLKVPFHDVGNEILFLEISSHIPTSLLLTLTGSMFPMLSQSLNMKGLTSSSIKDFRLACDEFAYALEILCGRISGRVILPLPKYNHDIMLTTSNFKDVSMISGHREMVGKVEVCVISWLKQIRISLAKDPGAQEITNDDGLPSLERNFWLSRSSELESILTQLRNQSAQKILEILRLSNSSYYQTLRTVIDQIEVRATEARNNLKCLNLLQPHIQIVESNDVSLSCSDDTSFEQSHWFCSLKSIFHLLFLVTSSRWAEKTTIRFRVILQQLANLLTSKCYQLFGFENRNLSLVQNNREISKRLSFAVRSCRSLSRLFDEYSARFRIEVRHDPSSCVWGIPRAVLFGKMDVHLERLEAALYVAQSTELLQDLCSVQIGSVYGHKVTTQCSRILTDFMDEIQLFECKMADLKTCEKAQFEFGFDRFCASRKLFDLQFLRMLQQVQSSWSCP